MAIGAVLSSYALDTFFTEKLPAGNIPADIIDTGQGWGNRSTAEGVALPLERVTPPDGFVYPENPNQGWTYANVDGQERLYDFDCDDRGYVYAAYSILGWGIVKDDARTGTKALPLTWQVLKSKAPYKDDKTLSLVSPTVIMSLKVGSKYYALVSDQSATSKTDVWDVSANPPKNMARPVVTLNDGAFGKGIKQWAKNADGTRFAYVDGANRVQIYDGGTYVNGGGPLFTQEGRGFITVASDGTNFWAIDS
ncbi:MAG TPA: hypothetical protein VN181_12150, partial [Thermoanaerobaculia bacterium]|nr:hypothetical protein [Thermoanaerobaculia bacterium]